MKPLGHSRVCTPFIWSFSPPFPQEGFILSKDTSDVSRSSWVDLVFYELPLSWSALPAFLFHSPQGLAEEIQIPLILI